MVTGSRWTARGRSVGLKLKLRLRLLLLLELERDTGEYSRLRPRPCLWCSGREGDFPLRVGELFGDKGRRGDEGCSGEREWDGEYRRL